jgi:hypothetical protein
MRPRSLLVFSAAAAFGLLGCEKDDQGYKQYVDQQLDERFSKLEGKLDNIERAIAKIPSGGAAPAPAAGAARPAPTPRQRPATPDPSTTYAVPLGKNSPYKGAEHAKVTIVDAFEFA